MPKQELYYLFYEKSFNQYSLKKIKQLTNQNWITLDDVNF